MKNLTYLVIKSFFILRGERAAYLSEEFQGVLQENLQERLTMSWQLQETMATITYGISYCISYGTTYGMYIIVYIYTWYNQWYNHGFTFSNEPKRTWFPAMRGSCRLDEEWLVHRPN